MIGGISGLGYSPYTYSASPYAAQRQQSSQAAQQTESAQYARQFGSAAVLRRSASPETPVQPVTPARSVSADEASVPELLSRMENDPAAMAGRMRVQYGSITPEGLFVEDGAEGTISPVQGAAKAALEGQLNQVEAALSTGVELPADQPLVKATALPDEQTDSPAGEEAVQTGKPAEQAEKPAEQTNAPAGEDAAQGAESAQAALEEGECQTCEERKYQDGSDDPGVSFKSPTNIAPEQAASAVRGHEMEHVVREQAKAEREDREVVRQTVTLHTDICPECGKAYVSGGTTETVTAAKPDASAQSNNDAQQQEATKKQNETRTPFAAVA